MSELIINPKFIDVPLQWAGDLTDYTKDNLYGAEFHADWEIPQDGWRDEIDKIAAAGAGMTRYNLKINDQNPESSCVCNATETAIRTIWTQQLGIEWSIDFSPMSLYYRIMSSCGSGSMMMDALEESKARGIVPESTEKNKKLFRHTYHQNTPCRGSRDLPSGWEQTARHFRPLEWFKITSQTQFGSAMLQGWPVVYGRSGHSICALELVYSNGKFLAKYAQSYGTDTGDNGYQYDSMNMWSTGGAWCLRATTMPDDPAKPAGVDGL